jgi:hypothetical protein
MADNGYIPSVLKAVMGMGGRNMDAICAFHQSADRRLRMDMEAWIMDNTLILPRRPKWTERLDFSDMFLMRMEQIRYGINPENIEWYGKLMFELSLQQEIGETYYDLFYKNLSRHILQSFQRSGLYQLDEKDSAKEADAARPVFKRIEEEVRESRTIKRIVMERKLKR